MYFNILCFGSLPSRWSVAPFTIFLTETNWRSNITAPIAGNGGFSIFLGFYSTCLRVSCSLFHYIRREFIVARVIYYTCNRDFKRLKVRTHLGNGASILKSLSLRFSILLSTSGVFCLALLELALVGFAL